MPSYNRLFFAKYRHLSAPVLLLILSSTLFACGQTEAIEAANSPKADAGQNQKLTAVTAAISNPTLLNNVSATVYKDIDCSCCKDWIDYAQSNGMSTIAEHPKDLASLKDRYSVPNDMRSCHTTVTTDGYVFEGHVPAKYVAEFLAKPPIQALGLAVPGMPMGSPGMEYDNQFMPYQVMQINKDGSSEVYASIETSDQQL